MTRWMRSPELDGSGKRDHFDPVVEGARHRLSSDLLLAIWERVCVDATDSFGSCDMQQARQRFHEIARRIAERGGRIRPDVGRLTRVDVDLQGTTWTSADELRRPIPGRETLVAVHAKRLAQIYQEPPLVHAPTEGVAALDRVDERYSDAGYRAQPRRGTR